MTADEGTMMSAIRVMIVDDNAQFRQGLRTMLSTQPSVELAGEATDGPEAVRVAGELQPDVILMDVQMPNGNGIDATRAILEANPHIGVLMLTMHENDDLVFEAMRAGARGYLLKGALRAEIMRAISGVASGDAVFGPAIARRLMHFFAQPPAPASVPTPFPDLTERELEILTLLAEHQSNHQIASKLSLAPKTVRNHVSNILAKLQAADRAEAILRAREAGLGRDR